MELKCVKAVVVVVAVENTILNLLFDISSFAKKKSINGS